MSSAPTNDQIAIARRQAFHEAAALVAERGATWRIQHPLVDGVDTPHATEQRQRAEECDVIAADLRLKAQRG